MNKYDFMFYVQAKNCNPNGDPDMGNSPRIDLETNKGIITDVAIKRRIRNYIQDAFKGKEGMDIIMRNANNINKDIAKIALEVNDGNISGKNKKTEESASLACKKFYDVRTFGAVLSTGLNAGQVRGPVQIGMSSSINEIMPTDICITRMCYTDGESKSLEEYDKLDESMDENKKRTMGRKQYVPYGLYCIHGHISASLAEQTGFNENDLKILFEAILNMYENDNSSSKEGMSVVSPIIIFKHVGTCTNNEDQLNREIKLGCAPAYKLFNLINISKKENIEYPRDYKDYNVFINLKDIPRGIKIGFKNNPFDEIVWNKKIDSDFISII